MLKEVTNQNQNNSKKDFLLEDSRNQNNFKKDFLLENGRIVNLKVFRAQEKQSQIQDQSPYVLNLKPKTKKEKVEGFEQAPKPSNLLNLKENQQNILEDKGKQEETPLKTETKIKTTKTVKSIGKGFFHFHHKVKEKKIKKFEYSTDQESGFQVPFSRLSPVFVESTDAMPKKAVWGRKSLAIFVLFCLLFSSTISATAFVARAFHLKDNVLKRANIAYAELNNAQNYLSDKNYDMASSAFSEASRNFAHALSETQSLGNTVMQVIDIMPLSTKLTQGPKILKIGEYLALSGEYLALTIKPFQKIDPVYSSDGPADDNQALTLTEAIIQSRDNLEIALVNLRHAESEFAEIDPSVLDPDTKEKMEFLGENITLVHSSLEKIFSFTENFLEILGHQKPKRYLLLFQNNNEMRATGGFIGSYGILDLDEGRIKNLTIDGIYNADGQLLSKITPPEPLRFTNDRWHARDANWFPDFPASAQKVAWLLEKAGKPSVDGVIALTPEVIVELLKLVDPIEMSKYETTIDADNFVIQTQREVELEYDKEENRPKQFLSDLAPEILERTLSTEKPQWLSLLSIFSKKLNEKNLLFYFYDQDLEEFVLDQGWGGEMKDYSRDYLSVINTNINGGKTDGMIQETIDLESEIAEDGSIINEVKITRHHTGNYEWPSINNINYLRLYVPEGSTLLSASGFDKVNIPPLTYAEMQYEKDPLLSEIRETRKIDENSETVITREFGKTCFGNWISIKPQETRTVSFKYKLPFKTELQILDNIDKYSILVQKQAGSFGSEFNFKLKLPPKLEAIWQYPDEAQKTEAENVIWNTLLDTDKYFGVALGKK